MCAIDLRERKLYGEAEEEEKEAEGWRKNAKRPPLFCLIDPIGQGDFLLRGEGRE